MNELDPRIVRLGIQIGEQQIKYYDGLAIAAIGMKYGNPNQNECEVKVANLDQATRNRILTETSPFNKNRKPKRMYIEAGRVSFGTTRIFVGDITNTGVSQPPDIVMTLKSLTKNFEKGNIIARNHPANTPLSTIAKGVASDIGVSLNFQAVDKSISNYSFTGGALNQLNALQSAGGVNCFVDDTNLIVKSSGVALKGFIRKLDLGSGMIGIPEITEHGVKVTFLIDNQTKIGSGLQLTSKEYPTLNGNYVIYKLGFNVTSRDVPFYYIAECKRLV